MLVMPNMCEEDVRNLCKTRLVCLGQGMYGELKKRNGISRKTVTMPIPMPVDHDHAEDLTSMEVTEPGLLQLDTDSNTPPPPNYRTSTVQKQTCKIPNLTTLIWQVKKLC